jgi:hypothetical protein
MWRRLQAGIHVCDSLLVQMDAPAVAYNKPRPRLKPLQLLAFNHMGGHCQHC